MAHDVRLEKVSGDHPTAVVRRRARMQELPRVVPQACGTVWSALRALQVKGAGRHVALYLDDQINLEVGVEMEHPFAGHGDVIGSNLPSGDVATAIHFGPYNKLAAAHQAIRDWCKTRGRALAGPNWEIYDHWKDAWNSDPSKIRTDVFYLLRTTGAQGAER